MPLKNLFPKYLFVITVIFGFHDPHLYAKAANFLHWGSNAYVDIFQTILNADNLIRNDTISLYSLPTSVIC